MHCIKHDANLGAMTTMTYEMQEDMMGDGYNNEAARASGYFLIERGGLRNEAAKAAALVAAGKAVIMVAYAVYGPSSEVLGEDQVIAYVADTQAEADAYLATLAGQDFDGEVAYWDVAAAAREAAARVAAAAADVVEDDDCPF